MSSQNERRKRTYESDSRDSPPLRHASKKRLIDKKYENDSKARIIWVLRGQKEVAAFSADNNPAVPIKGQGNLHEHTCSNCSTVYQHNHPYQKLHHPQHVKDCPQCRKIAPDDRPRSRMSGSSYFKSDFRSKYSNNRNGRRFNDRSYSSRSRNYPRRRSRSRSRSRSPRRRDRKSSPRRQQRSPKRRHS